MLSVLLQAPVGSSEAYKIERVNNKVCFGMRRYRLIDGLFIL